MVTSSNGNIFRFTGPLCAEFTGHSWISLTKANDTKLWCFLWYAPWINSLVNNRAAGDLRRHCAHFDVIVMCRINNVLIIWTIALYEVFLRICFLKRACFWPMINILQVWRNDNVLSYFPWCLIVVVERLRNLMADTTYLQYLHKETWLTLIFLYKDDLLHYPIWQTDELVVTANDITDFQ